MSADIPGKFGATIGRAEGQAIRLAMLFALLDQSELIRAVHWSVALTLWQYCVDSARYLFLSRLDDPHAQKILLALRKHPQGMTRAEISNEVFQHNLSRSKIEEALTYLRRLKFAVPERIETPGRPAERWFANRQKRSLSMKSSNNFLVTSHTKKNENHEERLPEPFDATKKGTPVLRNSHLTAGFSPLFVIYPRLFSYRRAWSLSSPISFTS